MNIDNIRGKFFKTQIGLQPLPKDDRDHLMGSIFGKKYTPKHKSKMLEPLSTKYQSYNTCGWSSSTGAKEMDENVLLSARSIVIQGKRMGYISGDGFSNLRNNELVLKNWGIAEENMLPVKASNWEEYSNARYLTGAIVENAAKHKTKSFLKINNCDEVRKAIDDNRPVKIGIRWYSGYNMSGGFSHPYIINKPRGYYVGGHALYVHGYDTNYHGKSVLVVKNSYGTLYGDHGDLYITDDMLNADIARYGAFVNYDLDKDMYRWLVEHQGKVVKAEESPHVYLIQGNQKRRYADIPTLTAHGKSTDDIIFVDNDYLSNVEDGDKIEFWDGGNVKQVVEMLKQRNDLKDLYKKYFINLFE